MKRKAQSNAQSRRGGGGNDKRVKQATEFTLGFARSLAARVENSMLNEEQLYLTFTKAVEDLPSKKLRNELTRAGNKVHYAKLFSDELSKALSDETQNKWSKKTKKGAALPPETLQHQLPPLPRTGEEWLKWIDKSMLKNKSLGTSDASGATAALNKARAIVATAFFLNDRTVIQELAMHFETLYGGMCFGWVGAKPKRQQINLLLNTAHDFLSLLAVKDPESGLGPLAAYLSVLAVGQAAVGIDTSSGENNADSSVSSGESSSDDGTDQSSSKVTMAIKGSLSDRFNHLQLMCTVFLGSSSDCLLLFLEKVIHNCLEMYDGLLNDSGATASTAKHEVVRFVTTYFTHHLQAMSGAQKKDASQYARFLLVAHDMLRFIGQETYAAYWTMCVDAMAFAKVPSDLLAAACKLEGEGEGTWVCEAVRAALGGGGGGARRLLAAAAGGGGAHLTRGALAALAAAAAKINHEHGRTRSVGQKEPRPYYSSDEEESGVRIKDGSEDSDIDQSGVNTHDMPLFVIDKTGLSGAA